MRRGRVPESSEAILREWAQLGMDGKGKDCEGRLYFNPLRKSYPTLMARHPQGFYDMEWYKKAQETRMARVDKYHPRQRAYIHEHGLNAFERLSLQERKAIAYPAIQISINDLIL